jgi:hypothetical protein
MAEYKNIFRLNLGANSPVNVNTLVIKLREGAEFVGMSARKYATLQLKSMRDKIREQYLEYKNSKAEWASPPRSSSWSLGPTSIA